jgi:DNA/RNA endonuclease G (NUC1)
VVLHDDYKAIPGATAYSRGHMVPNSAMAYWQGCKGNKATFITSNIVPQLQANNAGVWEALESSIAGKKKPGGSFDMGLIGRSKHVWVFAGPVYWGRTVDIEKMGQKEIWVPTSLWKTVIWIDDKGEERTCSWIIPHRSDIPRNAYMEYTVSIHDVYKKTGVNVLPAKTHPLYTRVDAEEFLAHSDE